MSRSITMLALAAFLMTARAGPADPMNSAACMAAREQLETRLAAPNARERHRELAHARGQALTACLGSADGAAVRSAAPQPAQAVPPVTAAVRPEPLPLPPVSAPAPPLVVPRAATITQCDPAGCWDSEGRRLNNAGPLLMGPQGLCSIEGGAVHCAR